jgi:hypothetical protein
LIAHDTRSGQRVGTVAATRRRAEHAHDLDERALVVPDVLEHFGHDHAVEAVARERQIERVAVHDARPLTVAGLACFDHCARDRGHVLEIGGGVVERRHTRAAAHRLERVAAAARPEVEQSLTRRKLETFEFDREHC